MKSLVVFSLLLVPISLSAMVAYWAPQDSFFLKVLLYSLVPIVYIISTVFMSSFWGLISRKGIVSGTFSKNPPDKVYKLRIIYGTALTFVFYFKILYWIVLNVPILKRIWFRSFGYKGSMNFVTYPDCWIRDLSILNFADGVYLANRATIGTNIVLKEEGKDSIFVDGIKLGESAVIGHLAMIAPGCRVGKYSEIGMSTAAGIRCRIGNYSKIGARSTVNHGVSIGDRVTIGNCSFIGLKCQIADDICMKGGITLPAGTILKTQEDVNNFYSSESVTLRKYLQDELLKAAI